MSPTPLPKTLVLNPMQQWRQFSDPRSMHEWYRERFGALVPVRFQGQDHVMVLTPEGAKQVFGANPAGYDPFFKDGFTGVAGPASLWVLSGEAHRRERQLFAPAVRANHFIKYANSIRKITRQYIDKWQPGQIIRAVDTTLAISRDVIMRLVFGVEEEELMQEGRGILDGLRHASNPFIIMVVGLQRPWFPPWRRYNAAKAAFTDWVFRYLQARRAQNIESDDVVGNMLASHYEDGSPMQAEEIRDELITILQGGHQTVAGGLAWTLYELGRHPQELNKLRAELESVGAEAEPDVVVKLPYLGAVCQEAIRMHPVLAECARITTEPMEILGHTIPVGNGLIVSITAIHHDPKLYPEPDHFRPERFLERNYSSSEFLPFGGAHRRCIGAALAEYEMRISLADMVLRWDFESAAEERNIRQDVAMGPQKGVLLHITSHRGVKKISLPVTPKTISV